MEGYNSIEELIEKTEGNHVSIKHIKNTVSGDLEIEYKGYVLGTQDSGTTTAYFCNVCNKYYLGEAPINEFDARYCGSCGVEDPQKKE